MPSAAKPRAKLSRAQAITIFSARASSSSMAAELASVYTVSEKAIRDIWTGRTWSRETWHLDPSRPLHLKTSGRPKGCKDAQPRKKSAIGHDALAASSWSATASPFRPHPDEDDWQTLPGQQASRLVGLSQIAESAVYFEDSTARRHRSSAACRKSPTHRHASVDEQLHEWDAFWRSSSDANPFFDDWKPC